MGNLHFGLFCLKILFSNLCFLENREYSKPSAEKTCVFHFHLTYCILRHHAGCAAAEKVFKNVAARNYSDTGTHGKAQWSMNKTVCFIAWGL